MILLDKYNTDEFTHRVILPGVCYVNHSETDDDVVKYYLSSSKNMTSQFAKSESVKKEKCTVVDFILANYLLNN